MHPTAAMPGAGSLTKLHRLLGLSASASRSDVRQSFLRAILATHPDQNRSAKANDQFQELFSEYKRYERTTSAAERGRDGFTTFGVGCSFSDDENERVEREAIMAMARRGVMNPRALESCRGDKREPGNGGERGK